jgi:Flp pilus assembly protein TadB
MSDSSVVVLFVALVGVASVGLWIMGLRRSRRDQRTLDEIAAHEHKKAA